MPLTGIVELSSLNEGERGQTTSEASGRKCTPRPACITRRSWRACLRLGDARERTLSNARTRKLVRGVVLEGGVLWRDAACRSRFLWRFDMEASFGRVRLDPDCHGLRRR